MLRCKDLQRFVLKRQMVQQQADPDQEQDLQQDDFMRKGLPNTQIINSLGLSIIVERRQVIFFCLQFSIYGFILNT